MAHSNNVIGGNWLTAAVFPLILVLAAVGYIPILNSLLIFAFALVLMYYRQRLNQGRHHSLVPVWLFIVVLGLFLGIYRPEGFNYPLVFNVINLHEGGKAFSLYLNTSKMLAGYLVLLILLTAAELPDEFHIKAPAKQFFTAFLFAITIVLSAYVILNLDFYPKPLQYVLLFALVNLLITCVSEEAFMRLIFQSQLERFISEYTDKKLIYQGVSLLITTLLFVATHAIASVELLIVFGLAGFLYGLIYTLTRNVFASIATHFTVNIVHFSFLTYPL